MDIRRLSVKSAVFMSLWHILHAGKTFEKRGRMYDTILPSQALTVLWRCAHIGSII